MSEAKRDQNMIVTLLGVSNADGITPVVLWADPVTHRLLVSAASASHSILSASHDDSVVGTVVLGDIIIGNSTPKWERLAGNITTTKKFLIQTGNGVISAAPSWGAIIASDIPDISATYALTGHNHSGVYSVVGHDHAGVYAPVLGADDNYVTDAEKTAIGTIDAKAPSTAPTFATSIIGSYLTASEILITDADKKIVSAPVASYPSLVELAYVKGVTSAIQTQLGTMLLKSGGTMTGDIILGDNVRVDLTLPTADTYCTGNMTDSFAAGYSSAVGDLVFMGSAGKWLEVNADAVATCKGLIGIALEAKTDTQAMKVALPGSMVRLDAWNWTVGATLYAGETLGAIQEAIPTGADAIIKVIGFAVSADVIFFMPSSDQQSTVA